jgi:hypothetical protein
VSSITCCRCPYLSTTYTFTLTSRFFSAPCVCLFDTLFISSCGIHLCAQTLTLIPYFRILLFPLRVSHHTTPHHTTLRHFTSVFSDNCATMTPIIVYEDDCVSSSSGYRTSGFYSYRYLFFNLTQVGSMDDVCYCHSSISCQLISYFE